MTAESASEERNQMSDFESKRVEIERQLKVILVDVLVLDATDVAEFDENTGLFGHLPELDSMAVATLFTEVEDRFDILIEDDDVDVEMLESFGGLRDFLVSKVIGA